MSSSYDDWCHDEAVRKEERERVLKEVEAALNADAWEPGDRWANVAEAIDKLRREEHVYPGRC